MNRALICVFLSLVLSTESAPQTNLITYLPGFTGKFPSNHYSGYVTVDESHGKKLFYYFVESERNPSSDPVVLWLNGGPGCSSFDGFVYEHGPFNFEAPKSNGGLPKLHLNPYSWSKVSNIIYLDSPAGVGYSYSSNTSDYVTGDVKTASDSHTFLLKWFEIYREFQSNPFYIAGESYAGVYVPTLSYEVANGLDAGVEPLINFKGYMIGNGCTDEAFDRNSFVPFAHGMGLISESLYQEVVKACGGKFYSPNTTTCEDLLSKVHKNIGGLNKYDILEPCYHRPDLSSLTESWLSLPSSFRKLGETERPLPVRKRMFGRSWPYQAFVKDGLVPSWPELSEGGLPCIDDTVATSWLNDAEVRTALHAAEESVGGKWELCTGRISYYHDTGSMIKYHRNLTSGGYSALIFSGDHDMCVPYTGSEAWTRSMGYKIVDEWRPWISNSQVAGYLQGYEKSLTFITIKGSGHAVPEYKPRESLDFYTRWLDGKSI